MDSERLQHIQDLFHTALEQPPEGRAAFLDTACGGDADLRAAVERYLDADAGGFALLDEPLARVKDLDVPNEPLPRFEGRQVGRYRILKQLGRGGMGSVFLAQRDDQQFKGLAAIKLIRRGMDTEDILRRFRNERQILAALNHPGIARLLDGGVTEEGLPYFVMEYVDGTPIDQYCDNHRLSISKRLELFMSVCEAVQFAHQNLVVHRDLKPSNILVTGGGRVKLLDFGIAKVLNPVMAAVSLAITQTEMRLMTPAYASPEQILGETITTASDVYALGILLYELLTGHHPYRLGRWLDPELARSILETEPVKPSTAVTRVEEREDRDGGSSTITPEQVSATRSTEVSQLKRRLRGDLDNIVMKALRKEPGQRYASAEQLAADVQRFLDGTPILARKATAGYRVRKFVLRHRVSVAAAALVLVSLVAGLGAALWQARVAAQERDLARQEAAKLAEVTAFVVSVFEVADPSESLGETITARALLDRGLERIDTELAEVPEVQATMMSVLGQVYQSLGLYQSALPLLEKALQMRRARYGETHLDVATSLNNLGFLQEQMEQYEAAEQNYREALTLSRTIAGDENLVVANSQHNLGRVLYYTGGYDEAEPHIREALALRRRLLGPDQPEVARTLNNLALIEEVKGAYGEAEHLYRQSLTIHRAHPGEHISVATTMNNLAVVLRDLGNYAEAEQLTREALAIRKKLLGKHPQVALLLNNLARLRHEQGDDAEAERLFREALAMNLALQGENSVNVSVSLNELGLVLRQKHQYAEAEQLFRRALAIRVKLFGEEHTRVAYILTNLAQVLVDQGLYPAAEALYERALAIYREAYPEGHERTAYALMGLGALRVEQGKAAQAEPLLREALRLSRERLPEGHWRIGKAQSVLGACLSAQGRFAEAEALLAEGYSVLNETRGAEHPLTQDALRSLIALYDAWGQPDKAAEYRAAGTAE